MGKIYVYTLGYNLVSETAESVRRLYEQNDKRDFTHYLINLGFPLEKGDEIPTNIEKAKDNNTEKLKELAALYGSIYIKINNVGVSQNTATIYRTIKPTDDDVLCSCEPDEVQVEGGWITAQAKVLGGNRFGYCAPILQEAIPVLVQSKLAIPETVNGINIFLMKGSINYGNIAYSGKFLNAVGGVPYLPQAPIYGYLESALEFHLRKLKMEWCILKDYTTIHTNVPKLYREWKNYLILEHPEIAQISFENWLTKKRNGEL